MSLARLRSQIDLIDEKLAALLARRFALTDEVGAFKRKSGAKVLDAKREEAVLTRVASLVGANLQDDAKSIFKSLMARSRARQSRLIVGAKAKTPKVVGICGMGLIGGSFEKAFRAAGSEVVDLKDDSLISKCDLVIVALPPRLVAPWIIAHKDAFKPSALVTDAAGVKGAICAALEKTARKAKWTYIGGHPMAGKERSGYANSDGALFVQASMILTPYAWTKRAKVMALKRALAVCGFGGFTVVDPKRHDEMIAYTSQLAHVVSSAYVRDRLSRSHAGFSAGSFQDMTRVATVDPEMWTNLFRLNAKALSCVLGRLVKRLEEYRVALDKGADKKLEMLLAEGRAAKELSR